MHARSPRLAPILVLGAIALLAAAPAALAQRPVEPEPGEELQVPFGPRDLELFIDRCGLDDAQAEAAESLVEGFGASFENVSDDVRALREETSSFDWDQPDRRAKWTELRARQREATDKLRAESMDLQRSLLENLKILLTDEQSAGWDEFERARLRRAYLPRVPFLGLRGDVEVTLERLADEGLLTTADLERARPAIERWSRALDKPLDALAVVMGEADDKFRQMRTNPDIAEMERWLEDAKKLLTRISDAHDRAAREVQAELGPDRGARFRDAFERDRYPRTYRQTDIAPVVDRIRSAVSDLTEEQTARIDAIVARFGREMDPLRRDLIEARNRAILEFTPINMIRGLNDDEADELETRTEELIEGARLQLERVLTPEQLDRYRPDDEEDEGRLREIPRQRRE